MADGLFLTFSALGGFSAPTQTELIDYMRSQMGAKRTQLPVPASADSATLDDEDDEGPADLSAAQARKFLWRCSDKTSKALKFIADAPETGFKQSDISKALGRDGGDLRGVWSGITRRTRNLLDDPDAYLIWWEQDGEEWIGWVSEMTHRSLRKTFAQRKA